jgi:hypothetical protein
MECPATPFFIRIYTMKSNHLVTKFVLLALMVMVSCKREEFVEMPVWDQGVRFEYSVGTSPFTPMWPIVGRTGDTVRFNLTLTPETAIYLPKFLSHRGPKPNSVLLEFELIHKAYDSSPGSTLSWSAGPDTLLSTWSARHTYVNFEDRIFRGKFVIPEKPEVPNNVSPPPGFTYEIRMFVHVSFYIDDKKVQSHRDFRKFLASISVL